MDMLVINVFVIKGDKISMAIKQAKNGIYVTTEDFPQYQDYYSQIVHGINNKEKAKCGQCESCPMSKELATMSVTFVVTESCNLNCSYCYEQHKTCKSMSIETGRAAVDMLFDKAKINGYFDHDEKSSIILEFIGGEPLLQIDVMDDIVEYFKFKAFEENSPWAYTYMISVTSNGVLYNTPKVQSFMKKNKDKVSMSITIDGNKKLHDACRVFHDGRGSYDIVEASVKNVVKETSKPGTKITLAPQNIAFLNDAIKNVWDLGIDVAWTNCVFEDVWSLNDAKILYQQMKELADYVIESSLYSKKLCTLFDETIGKVLTKVDNWCGGNGAMLAIGTDGKCFNCMRFMKYSLNKQPEQPIGDIYKGLDSVETSEWLKNLVKVDMVSQSNDKCKNCPIATGCSLCTAFNYDEYGSPNVRATNICQMHHARVLANAYFWNKLYKHINLDDHFELNCPDDLALEIISEDELNMLKSL
jgi:uncharacterized protein